MTIEATVFNSVQALVSGRVYPDIAPANEPTPYITWQAVGGESVNFLDSCIPSKGNQRIQVNVWGSRRLPVAALAKQVEDSLRTAVALQTTVLGAAVSIYELETNLYGTRQDFSVWG